MEKWIPPRSPHDLLQERYWPGPWKVLVICLLLNQTSRRQLEPIIEGFFQKYQTPEDMVSCLYDDLVSDIKCLGLANRRAKTLKKFSLELLEMFSQDDVKSVRVSKLYGCGKYASDAFSLFFVGNWRDIEPSDHALNDYHNFLQKNIKS